MWSTAEPSGYRLVLPPHRRTAVLYQRRRYRTGPATHQTSRPGSGVQRLRRFQPDHVGTNHVGARMGTLRVGQSPLCRQVVHSCG